MHCLSLRAVRPAKLFVLVVDRAQNTNSDIQRKAFADYLAAHDPYHHPVVIHTYPGQQRIVYGPLYGHASYDGATIQLEQCVPRHIGAGERVAGRRSSVDRCQRRARQRPRRRRTGPRGSRPRQDPHTGLVGQHHGRRGRCVYNSFYRLTC
jgi:hypothetical protein